MMSDSDRLRLIRLGDMESIRREITSETVNLTGQNGFPWIHMAIIYAKTNRAEIVEYIIHCGADLLKKSNVYPGYDALKFAIEMNDVNSIRKIFACGAVSPSVQQGFFPMPRNLDVAFILVDHGISIEHVNGSDVVKDFRDRRVLARTSSIHLMGALRLVGINKDVIPLIGKWTWASRRHWI